MTNTTVPTVGSTPNVAYPGSTTAENKSTSGSDGSFTSVLGIYFMLYVNWLVCIIYGKNLAESRDIVKHNKEVLPGEEEKYMQQLCTFKIGKGRLDIPAPVSSDCYSCCQGSLQEEWKNKNPPIKDGSSTLRMYYATQHFYFP